MLASQPRAAVRAVVMAAGQGTRMKSQKPKVLHALLGRPMVGWVVAAALDAGCERATVIVGYERALVEAYLKASFPKCVDLAIQAEQRGTAHAVQQALPSLEGFEGKVLILNGDLPCLPTALLRALLDQDAQNPKALSIVSVRVPNPKGYGRIARTPDGSPTQIIEEKDCSAEQRAIQEINTGIYLVQADFLRQTLGQVHSDNAQGEFYLTDLLAIAARQHSVRVCEAQDAEPLLGVNDRSQLSVAQGWLQRRVNEAWMQRGVTFLLPGSTLVEYGVTLGVDVEIGPSASLLGATIVGDGTVIGANCVLQDVEVGPNITIGAGEVWRGSRRLA